FEGTSPNFDGDAPYGEVTFDRAGNLYGVALGGGHHSEGMVYELTKSGGSWVETSLYSFDHSFGGPYAGVTFGADGNLYGTVLNAVGFYGAVYRLVRSGDTWTEQDVYKFNLADGTFPYAGITFDAAGNLYGATTADGPNQGGTAFELTPS